MKKIELFWGLLNQRSKLLVVGLVAGVALFLYAGFSSAGDYYYDGEYFTAGSLFLPDEYERTFFADQDLNDAYNWLYGDEDEELQYLNNELSKLRHQKIAGLVFGLILAGGTGYMLRQEEDFGKSVAKLF